MVSPGIQNPAALAKQARELFVVHIGKALPELVKACDTKLTNGLDQAGAAREMQLRRDAWTAFQTHQTAWLNLSRKALQRTLLPRSAIVGAPAPSMARLELLADGVMDDQILASRLGMQVLEQSSTELNDLRLRIQYLEKRQELPKDDVLLPDVLARILVDQWLEAQMTRESWLHVQDALAPALAKQVHEGYKAANVMLVGSGVMKEIDLQSLVKRTPGSRSALPPGGRDETPSNADADAASRAAMRGAQPRSSLGPRHTRDAVQSTGRGGPGSSSMGVNDETRMMTGASPLARARQRAQGVLGRLKRMLSDRIGGDFEATQLLEPSSNLQRAMYRAGPSRTSSGSDLPMAGTGGLDTGHGLGSVVMDGTHVELAARHVRQRTAELKQSTSVQSEKATIEVVALMFQAILAEERIPPSVRVWFARLQIPVLRVALAEPEFFSALQHPARRLIDRMGSCVMGFESGINAAALEAEIKRVVQVIEQYPETGRRVFQLVFDEFQKFLTTYLSEKGNTGRYVSVAQQVEQRETYVVQYTIELRKLLDDMPVRDEVRDFLFKVWVDVLAVASVKFGLKHEETTSLKQVASDVLWAASAKPDRSDRARVIQQLPNLLQRLRQGMALLGYPPSLQDQHIKSVSDTLADAFMSRAEPIAQASLDQLADRLANLEEYLPADGMDDLDLDNESIELITGVDASNIEVISHGGSRPNEAMRAWAVELQIGSWFSLDHNSSVINVQLAWRSDRGQLYMFVSSGGRCYLVQAARVAAYLQAGLLVPSEEEALTVRATRDALAKLDANPERLFN